MTTPLLSALSYRLADHRRARRMTQRQLAAATGLNAKSISSWESGSRIASLRVGDLEKLAAALGWGAATLLKDAADAMHDGVLYCRCGDADSAHSPACRVRGCQCAAFVRKTWGWK